MGECQNPLPVWRFVHPPRHGVAKNAAGAIGAQTFPRYDEHAPSPQGLRPGEKRLKGSMGLVLGATVKIDLALDWDLPPAQFGQRSLVETGSNAMGQVGIGGDPWSYGRHDRPDGGRRRQRVSFLWLVWWFRNRGLFSLRAQGFDLGRDPAPKLLVSVTSVVAVTGFLALSHRRSEYAA